MCKKRIIDKRINKEIFNEKEKKLCFPKVANIFFFFEEFY